MLAIYKKELRGYFNSLYGYIYIAAFLATAGYLFISQCIFAGSNDISGVVTSLSAVSMLIVPVLTINLFTGERRQNTFTLLRSAPVDPWHIVLAKYFAAATVCVGMSLSLILYALLLSFYTPIFWSSLLVNFFGFVLLQFTACAIGLLASAVTRRRIAAFISSVVAIFAVYLAGASASFVDNSIFSVLLKVLSPFTAYTPFTLGLFSLSGAVFLITFSTLLIIITVKYIEYGRVKGI